MRIGIIDTGSNTIRLAIFECTKSLKPKTYNLKPLIDIKNTAGLSNYVKDGVFTEAGVDKASRVLKEHIACAVNLQCDQTYIFATAVLRNAKNSHDVVSDIETKIGKEIELLSGEDEAKLGLKGAFSNSDVTCGTLIDLGGGSCEITEFNENKCTSASLKMGCVSAYSQFVSNIFPSKIECENIMVAINEKLEKTTLELGKHENVYGIGGSVRAVAKFTREMKELPKTPKHVRVSDIEDMLDFLKRDEDAFAHVAVRAVPDRIHSVVPGCIIIGEILKATGASQLDICKRGLREGFLLQKLQG